MPKLPKCRCPDPFAVAVLARISDKDKQTQASIDVQIAETKDKLVRPHGWMVVAEYAVRHRSRKVLSDPVFSQMLADARAGRFSRLCLHKFDRLGRRAYERETAWHILAEECGVEIRAALEPYDLSSRAGKLTKKTSEFIADVFLDNLAEETMKGMVAKVTSGGWVARAPFGYVNRREETSHSKFRRWVEVDPAAGPVVSLAFESFASGEYTLQTLADWLNGRGYTWAKGLPWRRDRVHRMLLNPFYVGLVSWNGLEVQGSHASLVDRQLFDRCRAILREHDGDRERHNRQVYALNRLLHFAELDCGSHAEYQAHVDKAYYRSKKVGFEGAKVYVACETVEDQVLPFLQSLEIEPSLRPRIRNLYRQDVAAAAAPGRAEAERLRRKISDLEEESRGYVRLAAQGKLTDAEFDQERARVYGAISKTRQDLASLEHGGREILSDLDLALEISVALTALWERSGPVHRKALAHLVFERISIDNAGNILEVCFADPFPYLASLKEKARSTHFETERAIPESSKQVLSGSAYRTGFEAMRFPGKAMLPRSGLVEVLNRPRPR